VVVEIDYTNTALYDYAVTGSKVEPEELGAVRGFLGGLKPYFAEIASRMSRPKVLPPRAEAAPVGGIEGDPVDVLETRYNSLVERINRIATVLVGINELVFGPAGIRDTETRARRTLADMAWGTWAPEGLAEQLCTGICARFEYTPGIEKGDSCALAADATRRLITVGQLTETLLALADSIGGLQDDDPDLLLKDVVALKEQSGASNQKRLEDLERRVGQMTKVVASSRQALADGGSLVDAALAVEKLAKRVLGATSVWCSDPIEISLLVGKEIHIKVTPRTDPELAHRPPLAFHVTLLPEWFVHLALGLTFLDSPHSRFSVYAAKNPGAGFEVAQSDEQDSRFTFGLTLAATWPFFDRRDERNKRWAIWIPEITVNPSDNVRAFALGAGFSWKILKVGGGILWTRHKVLVGQSPGQSLPTEDALRVRDAYGKPHKWYVGISLIGWPPFVPTQ
jgi:hypothetical protein